jgi:hypothetical protein
LSEPRRTTIIYKKLARVSAAAIIGVTSIAVLAQARFSGFGGSFGGFHNGFVGRLVFLGQPAFVNQGVFAAFLPRHRFVAPFFGVGALYAAVYSTCWTWVPTVYG